MEKNEEYEEFFRQTGETAEFYEGLVGVRWRGVMRQLILSAIAFGKARGTGETLRKINESIEEVRHGN